MIDTLSSLVNPFELQPLQWFLGMLSKAIAIGLLDLLILGSLYLAKYRRLPSRDPPIMKGLVELGPQDWTFLTINQSIEFIFVCHLLKFVKESEHVDRGWDSILSLTHTVLPMYSIIMLDDFFYYFAHRIMHMPAFYPWCHKHHHKQALPKRGYLDAANEHPMEQVIALSLLWITLHIVVWTFGRVHVVAILVFFLLYAATAVLNHTEFDVECGWLGYFYSVRAHEMHHRFPQCNYVQTFIWWDKLFGTFREYKDNPNVVAEETRKQIKQQQQLVNGRTN